MTEKDVKKGSEPTLSNKALKGCIFAKALLEIYWKNEEATLEHIVHLLLDNMVVVPELLWLEKETIINLLRLEIKAREDERQRIQEHIKKSLETKKDNLKLYNPTEPIYSKICGNIETLEELVRLLEVKDKNGEC